MASPAAATQPGSPRQTIVVVIMVINMEQQAISLLTSPQPWLPTLQILMPHRLRPAPKKSTKLKGKLVQFCYYVVPFLKEDTKKEEKNDKKKQKKQKKTYYQVVY